MGAAASTNAARATADGGVQAQHQALLDQGRFVIQHCQGCGRHVHFPRELCPHCGSEDLRFVDPQGLGTEIGRAHV